MTTYFKLAATAGVLAFTLAGCGGNDKSPAAASSSTPASSTSLDLPPDQIPPDNPPVKTSDTNTSVSTPPIVTSPPNPAVVTPASSQAVVAPASAPVMPTPVKLYANCVDDLVAGTYEEGYLANKMLSSDPVAFSDQILSASGFDGFGPQLNQQLCTDGAVKSFADAVRIVKTAGDGLWQAALDRVQGRKVNGSLPQSDDRMLYWARLKMTLVLRQWIPQVALTPQQRAQLQWLLEKASRGQYSIAFPSGTNFKRIIISGFDPFTLGTPGGAGDNIRTGNPSGAVALALNGKKIVLADGSTAVIQSYLLPVDFTPFREGMQEHTLAPFFTGVDHVNASITISQGGDGQFWIENWHGRFHGGGADNMGTVTGGMDYGSLPSTDDADIYPPADILGYDPQPWAQSQPEQFTTTTLPYANMIAANTGAGITTPTGTFTDGGMMLIANAGYQVIWHTIYSVFPDCEKSSSVGFNSQYGYSSPPASVVPTPPLISACALSGGGGNYLSNESGYRNTVLRDTLNSSVLAGHLHVPVMSNFDDPDDDKITDSLFESYRDSIVQQADSLLTAIAKSL